MQEILITALALVAMAPRTPGEDYGDGWLQLTANYCCLSTLSADKPIFRHHREIIGSIDIMPIYEYACSACGKEFEKLVRQSSPAPECPDCHSSELRKKLSAFAAPGSSASRAHDMPGPCGSCGHPDGPGACAFQ